jgi:hypothetical protein
MAKKQAKEVKETPAEILAPVVFKCKVCGTDKPIEEMKVFTRYFPPMVMCKDCQKTQ